MGAKIELYLTNGFCLVFYDDCAEEIIRQIEAKGTGADVRITLDDAEGKHCIFMNQVVRFFIRNPEKSI